MSVYAVSDLHGQYEVFIRGLEKIGFSDSDELYVIGDAVDRGPDGIKLLQHIKENSNMTLILGNHEVLMLGSVDPNGEKKCNGVHADLWLYYNGGVATYEQYRELSDDERRSLLMWLNRCYVIKTIELGGRKICLTHSYYSEDLDGRQYFEADKFSVWDTVWTSLFRDDEDTHGDNIYKDYDYEFITGHVPVQKARIRHAQTDDYNILESYRYGNLVDIDGGCAMGDVQGVNNGAIFLRLDDMEEFPVSIRDEQ